MKSTGKGPIHNLFVLNKSGMCLYGLNLTNSFSLEEKQLISSYFTALMSFTTELLGSKIKILEIHGNIKLAVFEKKNLYLLLLCDSSENYTVLEELIQNINKLFMEFVITNHINLEEMVSPISDVNLDYLIKDIMNENGMGE